MPSTGTGSLPDYAWPPTVAGQPRCAARLSGHGKRARKPGRPALSSGGLDRIASCREVTGQPPACAADRLVSLAPVSVRPSVTPNLAGGAACLGLARRPSCGLASRPVSRPDPASPGMASGDPGSGARSLSPRGSSAWSRSAPAHWAADTVELSAVVG